MNLSLVSVGINMDFLDFCRSHGIIIHDLPPVGVWKRYGTDDHPRSKNGAVKYMLTHGFVQNHATSTVVSIWKPDQPVQIDRTAAMISVRKAEEEQKKRQHQAMQRAVAMLNASGNSTHPYLEAKGFKDEQGNVLWQNGEPLLLIPMRVNGSLVGLQQIDKTGQKKFLYGQRTNNATFTFNNHGMNILCEGYATALSIRIAMKQMKRRYNLHVCFSAGNMVKVAATLEPGLVIADNDESGTGERVAKEIGWPYWISDKVGEDANDCHQRLGLFAFTQSLTSMLGRSIKSLTH